MPSRHVQQSGYSLATWLLCGLPLLAADNDSPGWETRFEAARKQSQDSGKPIFLVFR
ncbi:MAG: hypothetical protein ABGZ17_30690 [Planctomycetaceae bacterium]